MAGVPPGSSVFIPGPSENVNAFLYGIVKSREAALKAVNIEQMLAGLVSERRRIEEAIRALERVGGKKRRGRPPKWLSEAIRQKNGRRSESKVRKLG